MRIAWFTPFSVRSAIGEVSQHVTAELAGRHGIDVDIWATSAGGPLRPTDLTVFDLDVENPTQEILDGYDWCVYHYGDHAPYHGAIHAAAVRRPGIVVLHDRVYQNLFAGLWVHAENQPRRYVERMAAWYGEEGLRAAGDAVSGAATRPKPWDTIEGYLRFPLWEEAMIGALAIVTHSSSHAVQVEGRWDGPLCATTLPTYASDWAPPPNRSAREDDRLRLLTVGYVNQNKRVLEVVRLLGADPELAGAVRYEVVGPYQAGHPYVEEILEEIRRGGLKDVVELVGWCDDDELRQRMADADVFVNLREPTLEGGSASLVRQLPWGKPVVAFDGGMFGELPEDAIASVPVSDYAALGAELHALIADPGRRAAIGAAGRAAAREFTVERYADVVLRAIEQADRWAPLATLCDRVADELTLLGADPQLPVFDVVATEMARMFPSGR